MWIKSGRGAPDGLGPCSRSLGPGKGEEDSMTLYTHTHTHPEGKDEDCVEGRIGEGGEAAMSNQKRSCRSFSFFMWIGSEVMESVRYG